MARMLTISTGTFTAIDLADAAIRSAISSGGNGAAFATGFLLRVNFVGVGRFVVAVGTDIYMGVWRSKLRNERITLYSKHLHLLNAKVFYKQADVYIAAEGTAQAIFELHDMMHIAIDQYIQALNENDKDLKSIDRTGIEQKNPGLIDKLIDNIAWG
jgi:hypothetical protein